MRFYGEHKQLSRDGWAGLGTLLLHVLVAVLVWLWPSAPKTPTMVENRALSAAQFAQNRAVRSPEQRKKLSELKKKLQTVRDEAEQKKVEQELRDLTGQIVDLPKAPDNTPPVEARFLSEFNNKVQKESKSRFREKDYKRATNEVTKAAEVEKEAAPAIQPPGKQGTQGEKPPELQKMTEAQQRRERLALSIDKANGLFQNQQARQFIEGSQAPPPKGTVGEEGEGGQGGKQGPPVTRDFMPNLGVLSRLSGAPANDYLPDDVADGDGTFLNSKEFKFAPFFNRMKQSVSEHWRPMEEMRRRDPTGNIYGYGGRVTVVSVRLNAEGYLKNVQVTRSSGVDFLDREAIVAFEKAQPFLNPPKQLVQGGEISFPFGFHIEFNGRFSPF